ncbi:MAG: TetR/AcrR family transcriptional regulator [Lachnospiraceae bacterium]|nr:TetR/AcrR family transcriptional regulator [Lachnospiraceae bacterium]
MGKITGLESVEEIPSKVLLTYNAVQELVGEGRDINDISVSAITERAGIGKGTIYDYFDSREEIIACAFLFYVRQTAERMTETMRGVGSLKEVVHSLFDQLDADSEQKTCFVRFVHGATDNSKYSPIIQKKLRQTEAGRKLPEQLFGEMIQRGVEAGEISGKLPVEYVLYTVFCKVMTYMMCISTQESFDIDTRRMRDLIITGILKELKNEN